MTRLLVAVLLAGGVLMAGWAIAQDPATDKDEPPLRLKKKPQADDPDAPKKPAAEDKKPDDPDKQPEPVPAREDDKEVLARIDTNMRALEERLANKELGDATRQKGDDIVKDIESLIRSMENPPSSGGGGGGESQNDPSGGSSGDQKNQGGTQQKPSGGSSGGKRGDRSNQPGGGGAQQQPGGGGKNGNTQQPGGGQTKPDKQPGPMGGQGDKTPGDQKNGKAGNGANGDLNNNDLFKQDIWGHLPPSLRPDMNAYSSDKEMIPKYDALIKKASRTIAEQSSRKDK